MAQTTVSINRASETGTYPPGGTVDIVVTFTRSGDDPVTQLGLDETIPAGWTFAGVVGGPAPDIQPPVGTEDNLGFAWLFPPDIPFNLIYRLNVPASASGAQSITGNAVYAVDGGEAVESNSPTTTIQEGTPVDPEGEGEGMPSEEGEIGPSEVVLSREAVGDGSYNPGGTLDLTVTFAYDGGEVVDVLGLQEVLPDGWTFNSIVSGAAPGVTPAPGDGSPLDFAYFAIPPFPVSFTYRVNVPAETTGPQEVSGTGVYAFGGEQLDTNTITTALTEGDPFIGEGEGAEEGEGLPEGEIGDTENEVVLTRQAVSGAQYNPGGTVDLRVTFSYTGPEAVDVLAIEETIPAGWTFNSVVSGTAPPIAPTAGDGGTLSFAYIVVPAFPVTFTYRLNVPAETTGSQSITGNGLYSFGGPQIETNVVVTTLTEGEPFDGEGEGEGGLEGEVEGEVPGSDTAVVLSRTAVGTNVYNPGGTVDIRVTFSYSGVEPVDVLGLEEEIPPGWSFNGIVSGNAPPITPAIGAQDSLGFAYIVVPPFPTTFTYRLNVPAETTGNQSIVGNGIYAFGGAQIDTNTVTTVLTEGDLAEPEGEGEGAEEGEDEIGDTDMFLRRNPVPNELYTPGEILEFRIRLNFSGEGTLTALALRENLPPGWTFVEMAGGTVPQITPTAGASGELEFAYLVPPPLPLEFNYRVRAPEDAEGPQLVSGVSVYRTDGPELASNTAETTLQQIGAPDLLAQHIAGPEEAWIGQEVSATWTVFNVGESGATGPWNDCVYLSIDGTLPGAEVLLGCVEREEALASGAVYQATGTFSVPEVEPGTYFLVLAVDNDEVVGEVDEENNIVASGAVEVGAIEYDAAVSAVFDENGGERRFLLTGLAVMLEGGGPAADERVAIDIVLRGQRRTVTVQTDGAGAFSTSFMLLETEAGSYSFAARHPGIPQAAAQDTLEITGFSFLPQRIGASLAAGFEQVLEVALVNNGPAVNGLSVSVADVPAGVSVTPELGADALAEGGTTTLSVRALSEPGVSGGTAVLTVSGGSSVPADLSFDIEILPELAELTPSVSPLQAGAQPGEQTLFGFEVTNTGGAVAEGLAIVPPAIDWVTVVAPTGPVDVLPGETLPVTLQFLPGAGEPTGPVSSELFLEGSGIAETFPLNINVISADVGALQVTVEDELSFLGASLPKVAGARVALHAPESGEIIVSSTTSSNGRVNFANVPVGPYDLAIRSNAHGHLLDTANITIGRTRARVIRTYRDFAVQRWHRAPDAATGLQDFNVTIDVASTVPIPMVTVEPPLLDLRDLVAGGSKQITLTIRNRGNDAARGAQLFISDTEGFRLTPLVEVLGDIPAGAVLEVPVLAEDLGGDPCTVENASGVLYSYPLNGEIRYRREAIGVLPPADRCPAGWPQFGELRQAVNGVTPHVTAPVMTQSSDCNILDDPCGAASFTLSQGRVDTGSGVEARAVLNPIPGGTNLSGIGLNVRIHDRDGEPANGLFTVGAPTLTGISNVSGGGSLSQGNTAVARWRIVPGAEAADRGPFTVSARWTFTRLGRSHQIDLASFALYVDPLPATDVSVFIPTFASGPDPGSANSIAPTPFDFGLLFENTGSGPLAGLRLLNARPFIEAFDGDGALSAFELVGTNASGEPLPPAFQATVGALASGELSSVVWEANAASAGIFDTLLFRLARQGAENSQRVLLPSSVTVRELVRAVRMDEPEDDGVLDFLASENGDGLPDTLYGSDGSVLPVGIATNPQLALAKELLDEYSLTASMPDGWGYLRVENPATADFLVSRVERSDGKLIPAENAWITRRTVRDADNNPVTENFFHLLDFNSTGSYTVELISPDGVDLPPVADAGPDQAVFPGDTVTLDGSGSTDPEGAVLSYAWTIVEAPEGSTATLSGASTVSPTFVPAIRGTYVVELVVNDGRNDSPPDTVTVTVQNQPPVANAGSDQSAFVGDTVELSGAGSSDPDGDPLTFSWRFDGRPVGSSATLSGADTATPSFVADRQGNYLVELVVNDGFDDSAPDTMVVNVPNRVPVANAGQNQIARVGDNIVLDGSGSSDPDGDTLSFQWTLLSRPTQSTATLSGAQTVSPSFTIDAPGDYTVQLVVNDGFDSSAPATVTIGTENSPPVANAGPDQSGRIGDAIQLDGSGSSDPDNDPLTFQWSITSRPTGSFAQLDDSGSATPLFVIDVAGDYTIRLVVNDGRVSSPPDFVTVSTENTIPIANAGSDQSRRVGDTVTLNGTQSSDPDGNPLTYLWSFVSRPSGSGATLSDPTNVRPTFVIDQPGNYIIELVVNDGRATSLPDLVTISTENSAPVANAGPDQTVAVGSTAILDGSASSDVDNDELTFQWEFVTRPGGSTATLQNATSVSPRFTVDRAGDYVVRLVVNDGKVNSSPDTVTISTTNSAPVARTGSNRTALVGDTVQLDGSQSSDVDNDPLTYRWSFTSRPSDSNATLSDREIVDPTFVVDEPGEYVVQLIVNDGQVDSSPASVVISTVNSAPVANPGSNQTRPVGATVTLDGSASTDPDNDELSFRWSFTSRPSGSTATLSDTTAVTPTFEIDLPGTYVIQLIVNDGQVDSQPATVQVTTENSAPVARAGSDKSASVGETVTLDGTGSFDVDGDPITYSWSITSRPSGSQASLQNPTSSRPSLTLDVPGSYIVQLIVRDGERSSVPDTVTVRTDNVPPLANAGPDQTRLVGQTVTLDGSGSSDPDGDSLTYSWSFTTRPSGSQAALSSPTNVTTTFVIDVSGTYVAQLIVNDGRVNSAPDSVIITTGNTRPTANAGPDRTVGVGVPVLLDGRNSSDPDGQELSFRWSITTRPTGSAAALNNNAIPRPQFTTDLPGEYRIQLIVNDGLADSTPDSVTITASFDATECEPPGEPLLVAASAGTFTDRVEVTWEALPDDVEYRVWRGPTADPADAEPVSGWIEDTLYNDATAPAAIIEPASGCFGSETVTVQTVHYFVEARAFPGCEGPLSAGAAGHRGAGGAKLWSPSWPKLLDALPVAHGGEAVAGPDEAIYLRLHDPSGVAGYWAEVHGDIDFSFEWVHGAYDDEGWVRIEAVSGWPAGERITVTAGGYGADGAELATVSREFRIAEDGPGEGLDGASGLAQPALGASIAAAAPQGPHRDAAVYRIHGVAEDGVPDVYWIPVPAGVHLSSAALRVYVAQEGVEGWYPADMLDGFLESAPERVRLDGAGYLVVEAWHGGWLAVVPESEGVAPAALAPTTKGQLLLWFAIVALLAIAGRLYSLQPRKRTP